MNERSTSRYRETMLGYEWCPRPISDRALLNTNVFDCVVEVIVAVDRR